VELRLADPVERRGPLAGPGLLQIGLIVGDRPLMVAGHRRGAGHLEPQLGDEGRALGQPAGLLEQRVGPLGVGPRDRVVGLEQASGEGVVDPGEPVLAAAVEQPLGLDPRQLLGAGRPPRGELDARQLVADLGGPGPLRLGGERGRPGRPRRVGLAGEPLRRAADQREVGLRGRVLGLAGSPVEPGEGLVVLAGLQRRDDRPRQVGRDRVDRPVRPGGRRWTLNRGGGEGEQGQGEGEAGGSTVARAHGGSLLVCRGRRRAADRRDRARRSQRSHRATRRRAARRPPTAPTLLTSRPRVPWVARSPVLSNSRWARGSSRPSRESPRTILAPPGLPANRRLGCARWGTLGRKEAGRHPLDSRATGQVRRRLSRS
jgi:hypothetical protein